MKSWAVESLLDERAVLGEEALGGDSMAAGRGVGSPCGRGRSRRPGADGPGVRADIARLKDDELSHEALDIPLVFMAKALSQRWSVGYVRGMSRSAPQNKRGVALG